MKFLIPFVARMVRKPSSREKNIEKIQIQHGASGPEESPPNALDNDTKALLDIGGSSTTL